LVRFLRRLDEFGFETLEELADQDMVSDQALRGVAIGMSENQVKRFRAAIAAHFNPASSSSSSDAQQHHQQQDQQQQRHQQEVPSSTAATNTAPTSTPAPAPTAGL
jgi:hypothetical protein